MKNIRSNSATLKFAAAFALALTCFAGTIRAQDYQHLNYIINSTPSLQYSYQASGEIEAWLKEIENQPKVAKKKIVIKKEEEADSDSESAGMNFILALMGAYNQVEAASTQRRKDDLNRQYRQQYNQAKANRDYYHVRGQYAEARKWENVMETYKQK